MSKKMNCPSCKKAIEKSQDTNWLPFCSERCKLIDFGAWIDGSHAIPGEEVYIIPDDDMQHH